MTETILTVAVTAVVVSVANEVVRKFLARHDVDAYVPKTEFEKWSVEFEKQCIERRASCGSLAQLKSLQASLTEIREDIRELRQLLLSKTKD